MNFLNLPELIAAVQDHEQYQHEIKGKRIKKELSNLESYDNKDITFKRYMISEAGLSFFVRLPPLRLKSIISTESTTSKYF
jgi:hypothetical protein